MHEIFHFISFRFVLFESTCRIFALMNSTPPMLFKTEFWIHKFIAWKYYNHQEHLMCLNDNLYDLNPILPIIQLRSSSSRRWIERWQRNVESQAYQIRQMSWFPSAFRIGHAQHHSHSRHCKHHQIIKKCLPVKLNTARIYTHFSHGALARAPLCAAVYLIPKMCTIWCLLVCKIMFGFVGNLESSECTTRKTLLHKSCICLSHSILYWFRSSPPPSLTICPHDYSCEMKKHWYSKNKNRMRIEKERAEHRTFVEIDKS